MYVWGIFDKITLAALHHRDDKVLESSEKKKKRGKKKKGKGGRKKGIHPSIHERSSVNFFNIFFRGLVTVMSNRCLIQRTTFPHALNLGGVICLRLWLPRRNVIGARSLSASAV